MQGALGVQNHNKKKSSMYLPFQVLQKFAVLLTINYKPLKWLEIDFEKIKLLVKKGEVVVSEKGFDLLYRIFFF